MSFAATFFRVLPAVTVTALLVVNGAFGQVRSEVSDDLQKALLTENWQVVRTLAGSNDKLKNAPILRAIKGHACLALNDNDTSLQLFLSLAGKRDRQAWRTWALDFAKKKENESYAVTHYLKADALARMGSWKDAIEACDDALSHDAELALALNARGIARAALDQLETAYSDFDAACKLAPSFADARANLGTLKYRKRAIKGATREFEKAVDISKKAGFEFSLAKNGCACCYFIRGKEGDWEKAGQILEELTGKPAVGALFLRNLSSIVNEKLRLAKEIAAKGGPGSVLGVNRQITDLNRHIEHNRNVLKVTPFGGPWTQALQDNTRANMQEQIAQRDSLMQSIGETPGGNPGGVKTKEIEDAFRGNLIGRKELPVKTWFGLAQNISF